MDGRNQMTESDPNESGDLAQIRAAVRALCAGFQGEYWRKLDRERGYPSEFVAALTKAGLLAALSPREHVKRRTEGHSGLAVDESAAEGLGIRPIRTMMSHATTEVLFDNMRVPAENLIGEEGQGFRYILSGMNAERILIAAECIGDAKWFIEKATAYAKERNVFGRPIGQNQGVAFPIARAYAGMRAAELMVREAAYRFQAGQDCGAEANMAQLLAADASWASADMGVQTP